MLLNFIFYPFLSHQIVRTRAVKTDHPTGPNSARLATGWPLSGSTRPDSLISEPTKLEPDSTYHGLTG